MADSLPLRSIHLRQEVNPDDGYPFDVPLLRDLGRLTFRTPVTFLVGENGSGKSTLLEAVACAAGSITVGSLSIEADPTLDHVRPLADLLRLTWSKKTKRGFFLRAEDFFGFAKHIAQLRAEMQAEIKRVEAEYKDRSAEAQGFARLPFARELGEIQRYYGDGLDTVSHGEAFLLLFRKRFTGEGLYLLDEPEAPLSPMRQLELLALLAQMVPAGGQFIIATHSPLLMAFPGAVILSCDGGDLHEVPFDEVDHVSITRSFLANPEAYLRHLTADD